MSAICYIDNVCFVGLFSDEKAPPNHLPADWLATIAFSPFSMAPSISDSLSRFLSVLSPPLLLLSVLSRWLLLSDSLYSSVSVLS